MESIQQQISTLTRKLDRVYQIIDRLDRHVFENLDPQVVNGEEVSIDRALSREDSHQLSDDVRRLPPEIARYRRNGYIDRPNSSNYRYDPAEWVIAQQDILIDSSGIEISHQVKEQDLSPQVQIQRLTAQLTAAYNRIAALEEQLLAKRWK
jgi:uncharacterized coiled-coil protein SlyX